MGGGGATVNPQDIEVRRNHFFKPTIWHLGQPGFVGGSGGQAFVVKNHFELKNAQRVLLEGNVIENVWGGFSQVGYSVLITPKNQNGGCPLCLVTDVTVRYNLISHVAGGLQIANTLAGVGQVATAGHSYSIHDVVIDDIQAAAYGGPGVFAQISASQPNLSDVTINHVTAFPTSTMLLIGNDITNPKIPNFNFINNIMTTGPFPVHSTGGGTSNCASSQVPITVLNACFNPYSFTANGIITTPANSSASIWPTGNLITTTVSTIQFTNYNNGNGGDYTLLSTSPLHNAATDGTDSGANIPKLNQAIAGVR